MELAGLELICGEGALRGLAGIKLGWSKLLQVTPDLRQGMKSFLEECDG